MNTSEVKKNKISNSLNFELFLKERELIQELAHLDFLITKSCSDALKNSLQSQHKKSMKKLFDVRVKIGKFPPKKLIENFQI